MAEKVLDSNAFTVVDVLQFADKPSTIAPAVTPNTSERMNYIAQRQELLARNFRKDGVDAILITTPVNVTYLTRFTGDSSFYVVTPKNTVLVSDTRFEEQIKEEVRGVDVHIRPHTETTYEAAAAILTKSGAKTVAVEGNRL